MSCDPKDRHVLAGAVRADAEVLVTFNLRDFPASATEPFSIGVRTPDEFLQDELDLYPRLCASAFLSLVDTYEHPAITIDQLLDRLRPSVPGFVGVLAGLL